MILSHQSSRCVLSRAVRNATRYNCTITSAKRSLIEKRVSTKYFDTKRDISDTVLADISRLTQVRNLHYLHI